MCVSVPFLGTADVEHASINRLTAVPRNGGEHREHGMGKEEAITKHGAGNARYITTV